MNVLSNEFPCKLFISINNYLFEFSGISRCNEGLCKCIFNLLNNPLFHCVFHLDIATLHQVSKEHHVRVHTSGARGKKEKRYAEFRSQFNQHLTTPQAVKDIMETSSKVYRDRETPFAKACVHYHSVSQNPEHHWDFYFEDPQFTEQNNTGIGHLKTPTGDTYSQRTAITVFNQKWWKTTHPSGTVYDSANNPCGSYREVYNRDYFRKHHPNRWQTKLAKYNTQDDEKVNEFKKQWKFTRVQ